MPDYLIPSSMRSVASTGPKKRRRKVGGQAETRIKQSKLRDPLLAAGAGAGSGEAEEDNEDEGGGDNADKIFTQSELARQSHSSTSGRRAWKMRHKKGVFNPKNTSKNQHRVAGSFVKSKKMKG